MLVLSFDCIYAVPQLWEHNLQIKCIIIIIIICYEQALSVSQLKALGPDNAAAITTSQRAALGVEQRAAVDEAVGLAAQKSEITTTLPQKGGM